MKYLIVNIIKLKAEGDFVSTEGTYLKKDDQGLAVIG